jgi:GH24 family phage-related lysozyme (muramidase)
LKVNPRVATGAAVGVIALAAPVVMWWEGKENDPYVDLVGVKTVCYGETHGVQMRRYSDAECSAMLMQRLAQFDGELSRCITRPDVPVHVRAAFLSLAYNIGSDAACKSTAIRKLNAGDTAGACAEISRWTMAGGKVVNGLVKRRKAERELCESQSLR